MLKLMRKHLNKAQKGFTLIELLIVVAIIGILAAIAIPNLITAQRRARYSRSAGDTKSIITQAMVVVSDNNKVISTIPGMTAPPSPAGLWDASAPNGTIYMAKVTDAWTAPLFYPLGEAACTGGVLGPGCVSYGAHTLGGDAADGNLNWAGAVIIAVGTDDLGNGTVVGCSFDAAAIKIANPC